MINDTLQNVFNNKGVITIIGQGENFPHAVNSWNSFATISKNSIILPVGGMIKMQEVLAKNSRVIVIVASTEVEGLHGLGAGFHINGIATICADGDEYTKIKEKYFWARAMLKIDFIDFYQTA